MDRQEKALRAVEALEKEYPGAQCSLTYQDPLQLLISVRLAAQCTDARVNQVTPALFARFPTLDDYCASSRKKSPNMSVLAAYIKPKQGTSIYCAVNCGMTTTVWCRILSKNSSSYRA